MVTYNAALPNKVLAVVSAARNINAALAALRKTAWFLGQAAKVKRSAEASVRQLMSYGSISRNPPISVGVVSRNGPVRYRGGSSDGSITLRHTEYLETVRTSPTAGAFGSLVYVLNPSRKDVFKWAAQLARSFEKYRIKSARFRYVPLVPTSTAGRVMFGVDYDVSDKQPAQKEELYSMEGSVTAPLWQELSLQVEPMKESLFTVPATAKDTVSDLRLVDYAAVTVATSNGPVNTDVGETFCDYEIELSHPQRYYESGTTVSTTFTATTSVFQNVVSIDGDVSMTTVGATAGSVYFREFGTFLVTFETYSPANNFVVSGSVTSTPIVAITNGAAYHGSFRVTATPAGRGMTLTWPLPATGTAFFYITRYN